MSETKIFRKKDLDLEPVNGMKTMRGKLLGILVLGLFWYNTK